MKHFLVLIAIASFPIVSCVQPAQADDDADAVAGALLILGIAALAHDEHHYNEGWRPKGPRQKAMFEQGYTDGLHHASFDTTVGTRAYSEGYHAGQKERSNRLAHRRQKNTAGTPVKVLKACAGEVAASLNVRANRVHIVKSVKRRQNDFLVEAAVGHKHLVCDMAGNGNVNGLRNGRI